MGVVNVTPDSFSDGGRYLDAGAAVEHAIALARDGADILDVGGESTRPGAEPVTAAQELARVLPVLEGIGSSGLLSSRGTPSPRLSIDTSKAEVASAAIERGASLVNDVSALRADPQMAQVVAASGVECCLMHSLRRSAGPRSGGSRSAGPRSRRPTSGGSRSEGAPPGEPGSPRYRDVVDEVKSFLEQRLAFAVSQGVHEERVLLDPGIGFDKTVEHNLELLRRLEELSSIGRPLVIGTSRKTFIGRLIARERGMPEPVEIARRLPGTIATNVLAFERGASVFRVHDVGPLRAALTIAAATLDPQWIRSAARSRTS
jgi:dihydropteroate synthase